MTIERWRSRQKKKKKKKKTTARDARFPPILWEMSGWPPASTCFTLSSTASRLPSLPAFLHWQKGWSCCRRDPPVVDAGAPKSEALDVLGAASENLPGLPRPLIILIHPTRRAEVHLGPKVSHLFSRLPAHRRRLLQHSDAMFHFSRVGGELLVLDLLIVGDALLGYRSVCSTPYSKVRTLGTVYSPSRVQPTPYVYTDTTRPGQAARK